LKGRAPTRGRGPRSSLSGLGLSLPPSAYGPGGGCAWHHEMKACGRARPSARPCRPPGCSEEAPRGVGPRSGFGEARWEPAPRRWAACLGAGRRLETWRRASSRVRDPGASPTTTHGDTFNAACHRSEHPRRGDRPPPDKTFTTSKRGSQTVWVYAINTGSGSNVLLECKDDHGHVGVDDGIGAGHPRRPEQHCGIVRCSVPTTTRPPGRSPTGRVPHVAVIG
jgi:hypothetical protein